MKLRVLFLIIGGLLVTSAVFGQKKIKIKKKDDMYGLYKGKKLVSAFVYDEISERRGQYMVRSGEKWGLTDQSGKTLIPTKYDTLIIAEGGYCIVQLEDKFGAVDAEDSVVIPLDFEKIDHMTSDGVALVKTDGKWAHWSKGELDFEPDQMIFWYPEQLALFTRCPGEDDYEAMNECAKQEMLTHIYKRLRYPYEARQKGIQGMVVASFLVSPQGEVCCHKIERSVHATLDQAALTVLQTLEDWVPANNEGDNVWSRYVLPISYRTH